MSISRFLLTVVVLACCWSSAATTTIKIATISPDGSYWTRLLKNGGKQIESETDGRVVLKVYPGGAMGDDFAVLRKIRARQLHGGIVQTGAFANSAPEVQLYNMPMLFRNLDEIGHIRKDLDPLLYEALRKVGYEPLGMPGLGFAYAISTREVSSIADIRRMKVWSPKGDRLGAALLESVGITPIPLTLVDVLAGLQTGLIDTVAAPPVSVVALQWHTRVRYLLDIPFMYIYSIFVVDGRTFAKLSAPDQAIVTKVARNVVEAAQRQNSLDHQKAKDALVRLGIQIVQPSDSELTDWRQNSTNLPRMLIEQKVIPQDLYDRLTAEVKRVRATQIP